jgi:hypothetical protein
MKKHTLKRSILSLILTSLVLTATTVSPLIAESDTLEGPCELAFFRCASDALFIPGQYDLMINCYIGYAFCKKYVEGA